MADQVSSQYLEFDEAQALAGDMNELADRLEVKEDVTARRLRQLSQSVADPRGSRLSSLDVSFALDPSRVEQRILGQSKRTPLFLGIMEVIRNVLVLVPLVVTWISLANAAQLYGEVLSEYPELAEKPFLAMWQEGFEVLGSPSQTFSDMASTDFWLLLATVGVALIVHVLRDWVGMREELAASQLADEVEVLGWRLSRFLAVTRDRQDHAAAQATHVAVERFDANARSLADLFRAEHDRAEQVTANQEKVVSELSAFASKFQVASTSLQRHHDGLQKAYHDLDGAVEKLVLQISRQEQRQESLLKNLDGVFSRTGEMVFSTTEFREDIRKALEELGAEVGRSAESSATLAVAAIQMKDFGLTLAKNEETVRRALGELPGRLQHTIEQQDKGVGQLIKTLESFGGELRDRASELSASERVLLSSFEAWQKQAGNTERTSAEIADRLEQTLGELHTQVQTSNERIDAVGSVTENLRVLAQSLSSTYSEITRAFKDASLGNQTALDNFRRDVKSLSDDLKMPVSSLATLVTSMLGGQTKLEQALTVVGRQFDGLGGRVKESTEVLSTASQSLIVAANRVLTGEEQRQIHSSSIQSATRSLDSTSKSLQLAMDTLNTGMQDLVRAANLTGQEAEAVKLALDELTKRSVSQQQQSVSELSGSRAAMDQAAETVGRLPDRLDRVVTQLEGLAHENARIAEQLERLPERLESVSGRQIATVGHETTHEMPPAQPVASAKSSASRDGGFRPFRR